MAETCFEIVVYTVKSADAAAQARRAAMPVLKSYPGFLGWRAFKDAEGGSVFADVVEWASLGDAKKASEAVMKDRHFADLMAATDAVVTMNHLHIDAQQTG